MTSFKSILTAGTLIAISASAACNDTTDPLACNDTAICTERPSATPVPARTDAQWNEWPWMSVKFAPELRLSATLTRDSAGRVTPSLVFFNSGGAPTVVEYGTCSFGVRLYTSSTYNSRPVWDNRLPPPGACTLILLWFNLAPNTQREVRVGTINPVSLRDSLSSGEYWAAVTWRTTDNQIRVVPAGRVIISR